jgi:signal transduction histidine kinase/HAMP domain-containing protein
VFKPRTIRGQLIVGLIAFEVLLVSVFAFFVIQEHAGEIKAREARRFEYQSNMVGLMAQVAIVENRPDIMQRAIQLMMQAPSIKAVRVTDMQGRTILDADPALNGTDRLTAAERPYLRLARGVTILKDAGGKSEVVTPVTVAGSPRALVWIYPSDQPQKEEMDSQVQLTLVFAVIGAICCVLLAEFFARSTTRPLSGLLRATRRIIRDPADTSTLPPDPSASSEVADLTLAFNLMVASIEEQRAGLNDTLGLLDSMLAHAPIGIAFFDTHARFIRMNEFLAAMNRVSVGHHIGRTVGQIFPGATGELIEDGIKTVFATSEPVRDLEVNLGNPQEDGGVSTWLVNIYPVRSASHGVRWVGAVIVDTTGIKRSEDALRRTEKLAAVGRLSSSIAHEINNPLEAITNILYLLRRMDGLDEQATAYIELANHEVARMSEIVQQTLRFHRQSTRPAVANIGEILDSVLSLHRGKVRGLQVEVERRYRGDVELFCFSGEMRQLFANLIGNALDAMPSHGGRLCVEVRYSRSWKDTSVEGIRVVVADTGCGMSSATQRRIFEPFFTTKEATGTGLGLWVSAEIIQKHRGSVRVRSRGAQAGGKTGTVFMVFLPSLATFAISGMEVVSGVKTVV